MNNILRYKGYQAMVRFDSTSKIWHGRIADISDLVTFESVDPETVEREFRDAVDDYLAFRKELGRIPKKT